jgi:general secretion pathway protein F
LPWLAWAVLSGGTFMADNLWLVLFALAAIGGALSIPLRQPRTRERLLDALGRWPVVGPWLTESDTARWAKLLSALLGQGVPMLDALALANRGVGLASVRSRLDVAARAVKGGMSLSKALEEQSALSPTAYNLLRTGERAGRLPEMLRSLADLYGKSGRNRMKRVLLLVEPLAILLIGGAIGTIVVGIVLAITSVSDIPL